MNLVETALRRPLTILVLVIADGARRLDRAAAHDARHLPAARHSDDLRRAALRRHGPGADGGLPHLLLRIPLPLHHRHRARRIEVHPGRFDHEAAVSSGHGHVAGDVRNRRLREPRPRLHAAGHGRAVRHALRRRQRARSVTSCSRPTTRTSRSARCRMQALNRVRPAVRHAARRLRAAAFWRQLARHRRQRQPRPHARLRPVAGRHRAGAVAGQHDQPVGQHEPRRQVSHRAGQRHRHEHQGPRRRAAYARRANGAVFVRDVATVEDAADIITSYALANGRRTVYLPGHQARRRLDARGGQPGEEEHRRSSRSVLPRRHQGQLRVRPIARRERVPSGTCSRKAASARCSPA